MGKVAMHPALPCSAHHLSNCCLVFLKLFERIYASLTAGLLHPINGDAQLQRHKRTQLDRPYQRVTIDLDKLLDAVGL